MSTASVSRQRILRRFNKYWMYVWTALIFVFLYLPVVVIAVFSFEKGQFSTLPWSGFTLEWYRQLMQASAVIDAVKNSVMVAVSVAAVGTILGTLGAIALVRHDFKFKSFYRSLVVTPMTIPGLLLGIALLLWFKYTNVTTSLYTVVLGQLVFIVPFVLITVSARLRGFDPTLEEAARDLGASRFQTYRRITIPLLLPGIISGAIFALALSFDDFLIAFFTSGVKNTLPIYIFSAISRGVTPVINAISTVALTVSIILLAAGTLLERRGQ